jgi:hypothetical protein
VEYLHSGKYAFQLDKMSMYIVVDDQLDWVLAQKGQEREVGKKSARKMKESQGVFYSIQKKKDSEESKKFRDHEFDEMMSATVLSEQEITDRGFSVNFDDVEF